MKKRLLSMILALGMMLTILPVNAITAWAENEEIIQSGNCGTGGSDKVTYVLTQNNDDNTNKTYTLTIHGNGRMNDYSDYSFNHAPWYSVHDAITQVVFEGDITTIGNYSFDECNRLTSITIPNSVTSIGQGAFLDCASLKEIKMPDDSNSKLYSIGVRAFKYCTSLKSITIPSSVQSIGEKAFDVMNARGNKNPLKVYFPAEFPTDIDIYNELDSYESLVQYYYPGYKSAWDMQKSKISNFNDLYYVRYYCDVTFDPMGGTFADNTTEAKTYQKIYRTELVATNEANASVPADPKRTGYKFNGWYYLDANQQKVPFDPATEGVPDTMTLYADWTQTGTTATVAISGITEGQELIKGKEYPFTVTVTPNDDTDAGKLKFELPQNAELWYKDTEDQWEKVDNSTLKIDFGTTEYQFKLVPKESGANTLTVGVQKDNMTTGPANKDSVSFTVRDPKAAEIAIADLNNQTIKQNKPHTFTVTVTANDDSGNATLTFDNVAGLTYNNATVTDAGVTVTLTKNQSETLNFTLTPSKTGSKTLTATLSTSGATDTATYTVSEYEHAKVTIDGLGTDLKQGESKDFTVKVDPKDDSGNAIIDFGDKNSEIQYKDGEDWKPMPSGGLKINLSNGEKPYDFRITPKNDGSQTLTATVKQNDNELDRVEQTYTVAKKDEPTTPGGGENPGGGSTGDSGNTKPTPKPDEKPDRKIKIDGGIVEVNGKEVKPDEDGNITVKEGDEITVTVDKSKISDAQVFDQWVIKPDSVLNEVDPKSEKISFTMPAEDVTIEAMTRDASIEDDGPGILGTGALIATGVVGSAALLYQGHMLGTELYLRYLLPHGAVIPQNRAELAVLLWQDAENPEPVSTTLYSDISDEDSAIQQAARWAVENDLMEQLDAEEHPDHFDPFVPVTFSDSIRAWKKAQELKKSVH